MTSEPRPEQAVVPLDRRASQALESIADMELRFAIAVRQRELLADYIRKQLKPRKHFYKVSGADKPSLTKEGAEVVCLPHGLLPDYDILSGPKEPPVTKEPYQIIVKCVLLRHGQFAGSGIGSASSWITPRNFPRKPRQPDPGLCHNATLKMAQKSAFIAATLNATAASEFFTQDMEEDTAAVVPVTSQAAVGKARAAFFAEVKRMRLDQVQTHASLGLRCSGAHDGKDTPKSCHALRDAIAVLVAEYGHAEAEAWDVMLMALTEGEPWPGYPKPESAAGEAPQWLKEMEEQSDEHP